MRNYNKRQFYIVFAPLYNVSELYAVGPFNSKSAANKHIAILKLNKLAAINFENDFKMDDNRLGIVGIYPRSVFLALKIGSVFETLPISARALEEIVYAA